MSSISQKKKDQMKKVDITEKTSTRLLLHTILSDDISLNQPETQTHNSLLLEEQNLQQVVDSPLIHLL